MKKNITMLVVFAMLATFPMTASVGFPFSQHYFMTLAKIRSAETLFGQKNYAKAQEAFEELAAETANPRIGIYPERLTWLKEILENNG